MALSREINISEPDGEYVKKLWEKFVTHYDIVGNGLPVIFYPDKEFKELGIPTPWQTIAWRRIIGKIGEENFCKLPLELNYLKKENVLFEKQFSENFGKHPHPEKLEVTFVCGYFWKFNENRRDKMLNFVVKSLLEKGTKVEIWTQDETLEEAFGKKLGNSAVRGNLQVHVVEERIDVHYTLIEDTSAWENSRFLLELPHTEAHLLRLETYLTFGELKKFGCEPAEFKEMLHSYIKQGFLKKWFSKHNMALNTGRNKHEGKGSSYRCL